MTHINKDERIRLIKRLFWDQQVDAEKIDKFLQGEFQNIDFPRKGNIYYRILSGYTWYIVRELVAQCRLEEALKEEVVNRLKSNQLKDRFRYVRENLFKNNLSSAK